MEVGSHLCNMFALSMCLCNLLGLKGGSVAFVHRVILGNLHASMAIVSIIAIH